MRSTHELAEGGAEVEHHGVGGAVGLRVGDGDSESLYLQAAAEREAGKEAAVVSRHIGPYLVAVAESDPEPVRRRILESEQKMTEKVGAEI